MGLVVRMKIIIKKEDLPKPRLPIAPPNQKHKTKKSYDRKRDKKNNNKGWE